MLLAKTNIQVVWERFLSGDKEAFAFLYNLYIDELYRYGCKFSMDSDQVKDALHEVFLELYMNRKNYNIHPDSLKFYLLLALKRNLIKKLRHNRKFDEEKPGDEYLFEPDYSVEHLIIEEEEDAEKSRKIQLALNALPSKQKEAIYLRYNESMEYDAIARLLGISVESVRKQVYRALKSIREICNNHTVVLFTFLAKKG